MKTFEVSGLKDKPFTVEAERLEHTEDTGTMTLSSGGFYGSDKTIILATNLKGVSILELNDNEL